MATSRWSDLLRRLRSRTLRKDERDVSDGLLLRRFLKERDEEAFTWLVRRHGTMVLSVCQRILGDGHDAEDAFQAVFLVLTRKAEELSTRDQVGNWLYGVACRTALKARGLAARRRERERWTARSVVQSEKPERELKEVVDQELLRLPAKYRLPLLLCELEGKTIREAASQLSWPEGTVAGRLSRGRQLLRNRLLRHGIPWALGGLIVATLPADLTATTVATAVRLAAGEDLLRAASGSVATLTQTMMRSLLLVQVKTLGAAVFTLTLVLGMAAWLTQTLATGGSKEPSVGDKDTHPIGNAGRIETLPVDHLGDPLPQGAVARLGTGRLRHGSRVFSLAFSRDGQSLVAAGQQGANLIWDLPSGRPRRVLSGERVTTLAGDVSRDGCRLGLCPDDRTALLLDTTTGQELGCIKPLKVAARLLTLSPNGEQVALTDGDKVLIQETALPARERILATPGGARQMAFSADSHWLAIAQLDGTALVCDTKEGQLRHRFVAERNAHTVAFTPDSEHLLLGTHQAIHAFALSRGETVSRWGMARGSIALALSPSGGLLATVDMKGRIQLWDWRVARLVRELDRVEGTEALAFSPDGQLLAVGGGSQKVRLFDTTTGRESQPTRFPGGSVFCLALFAEGASLLTGTSEGAIQEWNLTTGEPQRRLAPPGLGPLAIALSPDGRRVAGPVGDHLGIWELETGKQRVLCEAGPGGAVALTFSPDGRFLAGASPGDLRVWDTEQGGVGSKLAHLPAQPRTVAFLGGGATLLAGYHDGSIAFWDLKTTELKKLIPGLADGFFNLTVSADGRIVATAGVKSGVSLWDLETGRERWRFPRVAKQNCSPLALSPDGRWVACTDGGAVVLVLDTATGQRVRELPGHLAEVTCLTFSSDSRRLYSGSRDTTVLVWSLNAIPLRARAPSASPDHDSQP